LLCAHKSHDQSATLHTTVESGCDADDVDADVVTDTSFDTHGGGGGGGGGSGGWI
jgi:hypothetical protein